MTYYGASSNSSSSKKLYMQGGRKSQLNKPAYLTCHDAYHVIIRSCDSETCIIPLWLSEINDWAAVQAYEMT